MPHFIIAISSQFATSGLYINAKTLNNFFIITFIKKTHSKFLHFRFLVKQCL